MSEAIIQKLVTHLKRSEANQVEQHFEEESQLVLELVNSSAQTYSFGGQEFSLAIKLLISNRIQNEEWRKITSNAHYLRIVQCLRLISRDLELFKTHFEKKVILQLVADLKEHVKNHFTYGTYGSYVELASEIQSTLKRVFMVHASDPEVKQKWKEIENTLLNESDYIQQMQLLLGTKVYTLMRAALEVLYFIIGKYPQRKRYAKTYTINALLKIFETQSLEQKKIALSILLILIEEQDVQQVFSALRGIAVLTRTLRKLEQDKETKSGGLKQEIDLMFAKLVILVTSSAHQEELEAYRRMGLVHFVLDVFNSGVKERNRFKIRLSLESLVNLAMSDVNSVEICNTGVQAVGEFLVQLLEKPEDYCQESQLKQTASELMCFALTLLRFIYSTERNRRNFKLLFSPEIFGLFVDIGNFNRNPQACAGLVPRLMKLNPEEIKRMEKNFAELQQQHTAGSGKQVGGYTLRELIGTGSYGQVYSAQKGDSLFAVKEIQIQEEYGLEERILKQVSILKQLDHPNIVKYYNSFKQGQALYLVMELVDGQSLLELVTSRKEKKLFLKESQIWSIVSQLCSALRYLHSEKKIMHRDIAPSNVLLDLKTSRIKLADFGLAKHYARKDDGMLASQSSSVMKSTFAGTIVYSSPQIVQSEPYSSKADIWSLGCVLYQLCALQPAFPGTNPLTIAKKIVECDYIPLDESHYSAQLLQLIRSCMTRETQKRPHIDQLCQAITPIFMNELDELRRKEETISYELESMKRETMLMKMIEQESKEEEPQVLKVEYLTKMQDPVVFILGLLHKINYLVDRCPSLQGDHRYTYVEQFKRHLYECPSIHEMKKILFKLQSALKEPINPEIFGQLSYEQMSIVLDECALELNYKL